MIVLRQDGPVAVMRNSQLCVSVRHCRTRAIRTVAQEEMEGMVIIPVSLNLFTKGR